MRRSLNFACAAGTFGVCQVVQGIPQQLGTEQGSRQFMGNFAYMTTEETVELCVEKTRVGMESSLDPSNGSSQVGVLKGMPRDLKNRRITDYTTAFLQTSYVHVTLWLII